MRRGLSAEMVTLDNYGRGLEIGRLHYYPYNEAREGFHAWADALIKKYENSGCKEIVSTWVQEFSQTVEIVYRRKQCRGGR